MAEDLHLKVVTTADSSGLTDAARDVEKLKGETDHLGETFTAAGDASDDLTAALDHQGQQMAQTRSEAAKLNTEIEASTKKVKELQTQLVEGGNDKKVRTDLRAERSWLAELERIQKSLGGGKSSD